MGYAVYPLAPPAFELEPPPICVLTGRTNELEVRDLPIYQSPAWSLALASLLCAIPWCGGVLIAVALATFHYRILPRLAYHAPAVRRYVSVRSFVLVMSYSGGVLGLCTMLIASNRAADFALGGCGVLTIGAIVIAATFLGREPRVLLVRKGAALLWLPDDYASALLARRSALVFLARAGTVGTRFGETAGQCAAHPGVAASGTCGRCGDFLCAQCLPPPPVAAAICPRCTDLTANELIAEARAGRLPKIP